MTERPDSRPPGEHAVDPRLDSGVAEAMHEAGLHEAAPDDEGYHNPLNLHHDVPAGHSSGQLFLERFETVLLLGGIASFMLSVTALGYLPGKLVQEEIQATTPKTARGYTPLELQGRQVYMRDGCAYCHTQFVRPVASDVRYWGYQAEAWEGRNDYPHLYGTRRIGPDLSREAGRRDDQWQYAHLKNPRSTVPDSIMPAFPWYFEDTADGTIRPNEEGRAVVAYLNSLGRDIEVSGPTPRTAPTSLGH